jgi:hypothetical protein
MAAWYGSGMRISTPVLHANMGIMYVRMHHKQNSRNRELLPHSRPHQWPRSKIGPFVSARQVHYNRTEIKPGKRSDTRIKPLLFFTNGHDCYKTVTTERELVSVGEWPSHTTVIKFEPFRFLKRPRAQQKWFKIPARTSRKATWIQKWFKIPARTSRKLYVYNNNGFARQRRWAWL